MDKKKNVAPKRLRFQDGSESPYMGRTYYVQRRPWVMEPNPGDDEAPKDPGALQIHQNYSEKDFEGHRAHTVFVGVHVPSHAPVGHRRHSHHRRHHHHHHHHNKDEQQEGRPITPPSQRVHFILGEEEEAGLHESHPLFSEMEELVSDGADGVLWKETARWVKFEEDVDEGGNRWSKPHVGTLSLHSLFELRSMILNGTVMLDMEATKLDQIADLVLDNMINTGHLSFDLRDKVRETLLRKHRHQHERKKDNNTNVSRLPIIRSLAEIGKTHSASKSFGSSLNLFKRSQSMPTTEVALKEWRESRGNYLTVPGTGGEGMEHSPSTGSITKNHSGTNLEHMQNGDSNASMTTAASKANLHFMKKIPPGAEASNILIGELDVLEKTLSGFIRLSEATLMGDLTEVPVPTRFIFILLGPSGGISRYHEIGRAIATLMSDEVFHDVAYKAKNRSHLLAGVDEFLDAVTVLPPGEWDPSIRIEPPAAVPSQDPRKHPDQPTEHLSEEEEEQRIREQSGLVRSGRIFGGLINDIKRRKRWYLSDFKDSLAIQSIASWIFLYFACLTPIITFGGLLGEATENRIAAMESLVAGCICGIVYGLFSGQPLTILGSTGPVLVFETILFDFCKGNGLDYLSFRWWIGIYVGLILIVLVAIDASALVCFITRFTEENFALLIACIFMYKAVQKVVKIGHKYPIAEIDIHQFENVSFDCYCMPSNTSNQLEIDWSSLSKENCTSNEYNGTLSEGCDPPHLYPDVFLMSIILFAGTFTLSIMLKDFKNSLFFPTKIRTIISDFAVVIAIFVMTLVDSLSGVTQTPKLEVPQVFKPTWEGRGWFIPPFGNNPVWTAFAAPVPALLATILIFMDQQITAVIVNRKEHKLKKGCGYHLDLFVVASLIIICSIFGLPWFVAATVLAINHVNSLKLESETAAPGEKPQFLGVREQRVTQLLIFITVGVSVVLTSVLKKIPMAVLFGVFLYMGAAALKGLQFYDRILILFMPVKYQPDLAFLRQIPLMRVHMFTFIQLACFASLWAIKSFKETSILFPLMLVVMVLVRKLLDFVFTQRELKILDDALPELTRRHKEEERLKREEEELANAAATEADAKTSLHLSTTGNIEIPMANGNIIKIPLESINISEEVNKTGLWQQVNSMNSAGSTNDKKSPTKNSSKSKKRGSQKDARHDEEKKRLSGLPEEEEDDGGITIKMNVKVRKKDDGGWEIPMGQFPQNFPRPFLPSGIGKLVQNEEVSPAENKATSKDVTEGVPNISGVGIKVEDYDAMKGEDNPAFVMDSGTRL